MGFPAVTADDGVALVGLGPGKPLALLAYLAVRREARREELVDLLWGEVAEANARNAFRQALHRLRTALGDELVPPDRERVGLVQSDVMSIDRDDFLAAVDRNDVAAAVEVYRGGFLDGFTVGEPLFDDWADAERNRLRARFQSALQSGAENALASGRWLEALQYVQRLSSIAPFDEDAALLEANVLVAAGRGAEAVNSLRRFTQVLRDQLDLAPSQRVKDLIARVERFDSRAEPRRGQAVRSTAAAQSLFVGREAEIGKLMGALRELNAERGGTIVIEGDVGIGKSRLLDEVLSRARASGPLLALRGRERSLGASLPYASISEALRNALKAPGISGTGPHLLAEASRILPELRDAFELPQIAPIEDEGGRLRFFEGVAALLDSVAYEQPVCLVLDDMHNASLSTVDLLVYLSARLQSSPVLILVAYRGDDGTSVVDRFRALSAETHRDDGYQALLSLPAMPDAQIVRVVESIVSLKGVQDQVDVRRIAAAASGNPLRAIDLARRALNGEPATTTPKKLRDVLWERLQKSAPSQRRVFFAAALIQRRTSLRLLASAAHLPEAATLEAAAELENAGLLSQEGDGFVVAHDFTTSFVAEASGVAGRALLAGWAADALVTENGATGAELAQLYSMAGRQGPAFVQARRGAYEAAAAGANAEAQRLLGLAMSLAPDAKHRAEIDAMLAAFGAGRLRLLSPDHSTPSASAQSDSSSTAAPAPDFTERRPPATAAETRRKFGTPRLYWLTAVLLAATGLLLWRRSVADSAGFRALSDSLLVTERGADRSATLSVITGPLSQGRMRMGSVRNPSIPQWLQNLKAPWIHPVPSPDAQWIAIERMTDSGSDVFLLGRDTMSRIPVATGDGANVVMGWSPDGSRVLVRRGKTLRDGGFDADLWAYRVVPGGMPTAVAIDTSSQRSIREAQWSPDGTRVAWVAQVGPTRQQDVFISRADGSGVQNLTDDPSEDYHISWSADGNLLAFTSDRRGNPDLFAFDFEGSPRIWSLTNSKYPEDFASFSPDSRYVAYQSTRDSDAAVYVMPALGGTSVRVTPTGGQYSIAGWRGTESPVYVDRFRVIGPSSARLGDSTPISLLGVDDNGISRLPDTVPVQLLDQGTGELRPSSADSGPSHRFVFYARHAGDARIAASIPGWRYDTLVIHVASSVERGFSEDFRAGISNQRWMALGTPAPFVKRGASGTAALFPNGDAQWLSGLLSRDAFALRSGISVAATFTAPFDGPPLPGALLELSLVADSRDASIDKVAPQLTEYVRVVWDGEASRLTYAVGPEGRSDPVAQLPRRTSHLIRVSIGDNGAVTFYVDGALRWTSSLRFLGGLSEPQARIWLAGKASAAWGSIANVELTRR